MSTTERCTYDEAEISSTAFWSLPACERDQTFATLRRERPVSFQRPPEGGLVPPEHGFWAVVGHREVIEVSRSPDLFSSAAGANLEDAQPALSELVAFFLAMDAPRHTTLRRLVTRAFTPRNVARIETQICDLARVMVAEAVAHRDFDLVQQLSMPFPLRTLAEMVGIPMEHRDTIYWASNVIVGPDDPDFVPPGEVPQTMAQAILDLHQISIGVARARRQEGQDDLMTALVEAEVDGRRLADEEIGGFFTLLTVAGNDTSRNSISHGVHAFAQFPDQWDLLRSDPDRYLKGAVEEVLRWATPALHMRRTATRDTVLAGQPIAAGDWVVMFYLSANRDESVFPDPWRFDITRDPNDHLAFGGGGPHFCLGAFLARTQLRAVFRELAERVQAFHVGEPQYLASNFIHGVKRLPCQVEPA